VALALALVALRLQAGPWQGQTQASPRPAARWGHVHPLLLLVLALVVLVVLLVLLPVPPLHLPALVSRLHLLALVPRRPLSPALLPRRPLSPALLLLLPPLSPQAPASPLAWAGRRCK
jgi:hypothetical protein